MVVDCPRRFIEPQGVNGFRALLGYIFLENYEIEKHWTSSEASSSFKSSLKIVTLASIYQPRFDQICKAWQEKLQEKETVEECDVFFLPIFLPVLP